MAIRTDINDMVIGDKISCEYTASSNTMGTFANLGSAVKAEIPLSSSSTPDGTFYFIMVGYDYLGRKKLIADRNIQHSISWDTLNKSGVAASSGNIITINNVYSNRYELTLRLLTGGVSSTDRNNEWDKIIVKSNLNGTITPGDNNVWNWNKIWSQTSTTNTSGAGNRTVRGYTAVDGSSYIASNNTIAADTGFRPVLLVKTLNTLGNFSVDKTEIHNDNVNITGEISDLDNNQVQYRILLNNAVIKDWSELLDSPVSITYTVQNSLFILGDNTLTIEYKNSNNTRNIWKQNITLINTPATADLSVDKIYTHSDNIVISGTISDVDSDDVQYKISVIRNGNTEVIQDWINLQSQPLNLSYALSNSYFAVGENTVVVDYRDKFGQGGSWQVQVWKTNVNPIYNLVANRTAIYDKPITISGSISDPDGDPIRYRVNGGEWTAWVNSPASINLTYQPSDFNVGPNNVTIDMEDTFGGINSYSVVIYKKSHDSTYISSANPNMNYFNDTSLKISESEITLFRINSVDARKGYLKQATLTLKMKTTTGGTIKVAKILADWDSTTVTGNTCPNIDTANAITQSVVGGEIINLDVSNSGPYGIAIYSVSDSLEANYYGHTESIIYQPTILQQPKKIYAKRVLLDWLDIVLEQPSSYIKTIVKRSNYSNMSAAIAVAEISDMSIKSFEDTSIEQNKTYYYRIDVQTDTVLNANIVQVITPDLGFKRELVGSNYVLKLAEGLAFDDVGVDYNFYTTPDKIKMRPLNIGTVIGGSISSVYAVEIINGYENMSFDITLRAVKNGLPAKEMGTYCLLPDATEDEFKTKVEMSLSDGPFNPVYPVQFRLSPMGRAVLYIRIKPTLVSAGDEMFQIVMSGKPV
jgi:hypothetical protein